MFYADPAYGGSGRTYTNDAAPVTGFFNGGHDPLFEQALEDFGNMSQYFVTQLSNVASTIATSVTSNGTGTGDKTFTVQSGKNFVPGMFVLVTYDTAISEQMFGRVKTYSGTTLVVTVIRSTVAGTRTAWSIHAVPTRVTNNLGVYTFAELLALTDMVEGDIVAVRDVGGFITQWIYTGGLWIPVNGSILLYKNNGSAGTPLASYTGAAGDFAITDPTLNPNLLRAGSVVRVSGRVKKGSSNGTPRVLVTLGTAGATATDPPIIRTSVFNIALGTECEFVGSARLGSATNFSGTRSLVPNVPLTSGDSSSETINVGVTNLIKVGITGGNSLDTHQLINLMVEVFP